MAVAVPTTGKVWPDAQLTREARPLLIAWKAGASTTRLVLPLTLPAVALSVIGFWFGWPSVTVTEAVPPLQAGVEGLTATDWPSLLVRVTGPLQPATTLPYGSFAVIV